MIKGIGMTPPPPDIYQSDILTSASKTWLIDGDMNHLSAGCMVMKFKYMTYIAVP